MIPTMIAISIIVFTIIQLPPGNYLESYIAELQAQGESVDPQKIAFLKQEYGLDKPLVEQYLRWAGGMLVAPALAVHPDPEYQLGPASRRLDSA